MSDRRGDSSSGTILHRLRHVSPTSGVVSCSGSTLSSSFRRQPWTRLGLASAPSPPSRRPGSVPGERTSVFGRGLSRDWGVGTGGPLGDTPGRFTLVGPVDSPPDQIPVTPGRDPPRLPKDLLHLDVDPDTPGSSLPGRLLCRFWFRTSTLADGVTPPSTGRP